MAYQGERVQFYTPPCGHTELLLIQESLGSTVLFRLIKGYTDGRQHFAQHRIQRDSLRAA